MIREKICVKTDIDITVFTDTKIDIRVYTRVFIHEFLVYPEI